jgi:NAD(P)-dependent dehydrogenase (short-subunit alcohol dehydrogenase family)
VTTRVALVTGGSRGIGRAIALALGREGVAVAVTARHLADAEKSAAELRAAGGKAHALALDVAEAASVDAGVAEAVAALGRIDVLVNNAGVAARDGSLALVSLDTFEDVFRTNVFGLALITRALLPLLGRGSRRTIVNVSSSLGSLVNTQGGFSYAYCASKAALNLLTVYMHKELAKDGFTVISLDPGWNRTDMGGGQAPLDPRDTVRSMVGLMGRFDRSDSGKFIGWDGAIRPW